ncbi:SE1832 family protein [Virgibacillus ndiopensis]|uniref:SE1832 family protein n=1 Tax=Virgibacillus ndiopensis TaxID=2004408 RepID=UPI000C072D33|nr:SE1832 family protein [Virgibacillus ndiopensis]
MTKKEIEAKLAELKSDYVRIQADMEKLVLVGGRTSTAEKKLIELEEEIKKMNHKLDELDK